MKRVRIMRLITIITSFVLLMGILPQFSVSAAYENTHVNTGNQREDIVAVAETQIGYQEGANNDTKYNRWNGTISGYPADGYGYPWCHCFVSWCANQAGISTDIIPRTAGTSTGRAFFVNQGTYKQSAANGGSYVPQRGDIIYYGSGSSPSHVGIVSNCDGSTVYTIEGNYSDKVGTRAISLSNSYIIGYGVPNYNGAINLATPTISTDKSSYTVGDTVNISWTPSPAGSNLSHYWLNIAGPNGEYPYSGTMNLNTSYSFVASQAGEYTITTYATPKGSLEGEGSLTDTVTVTVNAPKPIEFYCTTNALTLSTDYTDEWRSYDINFWYYNYSEGVTIGFEHGENQKTTCKWGEWSNSTVPLTITALEGCENGTELLKVYLKNTATGERLAEKTISVKLLNNAIYASESFVTINRSENETKQIILSYETIGASRVYVKTEQGSYGNVTLQWGDWSNNCIPVTLKGITGGSNKIVFKLINDDTEEVLATTAVNVTVIENKCSVYWYSNFVGGSSRCTTYTWGEKFGEAANIPPAQRPGYIFVGWYNGNTKITPDTIVPNEYELRLNAQWKADGVYLSIDTVELTLDELIAADYRVKVPVRVSGSGGYYELGYGISWNTDELNVSSVFNGAEIMEVSHYGVVSHVPAVNNEEGLLWAGISDATFDENFNRICIEDGIVANIYFTVNPSAAAGDKYIITALDTNNGTRAIITTADGSGMYYNLSNGAIIIKENPVYGDLNQDGIVTILDAVLLQKYLLNLKPLTTEQMELADINGDGKVNILDMSQLKALLQ